jgi:hypothetical protein
MKFQLRIAASSSNHHDLINPTMRKLPTILTFVRRQKNARRMIERLRRHWGSYIALGRNANDISYYIRPFSSRRCLQVRNIVGGKGRMKIYGN